MKIYTRFEQDTNDTKKLQNHLKNCIGKNTVTVYNCIFNDYKAKAVYHYNALIAVYVLPLDIVYLNKNYYSYSASTSRVRNEFIRFYSGINEVATTRKIDTIYNSGYFSIWDITYRVMDIESNRKY